jgi:hypothetical protein
MEKEPYDMLLLLRDLHLQQDQLLRLTARLRAMQATFAESTHPDRQALSDKLSHWNAQLRSSEQAPQALQRIGEIIHLLKLGQFSQTIQ